MSSPITPPSAGYAAQAASSSNAALLLQIQECLCQTAQYIILTPGLTVPPPSTSTNTYANMALQARYIAANSGYYAGALAPQICADGTITASSSDTAVANQIWTLWPVFSYNTTTVAPTGPTTP